MDSYDLHFEASLRELDIEEREEDALSFCDLPLHEHSEEEEERPASVSDPDDFFEFAIDPIHGYFPMDVVIFCGKSIICSKPITIISTPEPQLNKQFSSRSESFKLGHCPSSKPHAIQEHKSLKSKSRKHVMGLVKYPQQEMDLNEIRKRQSRRAPAPMFPVNGGEKPEVKSQGKEQSGVMRPPKCRSHWLSALAKAVRRL